jgi:hypothetical protein
MQAIAEEAWNPSGGNKLAFSAGHWSFYPGEGHIKRFPAGQKERLWNLNIRTIA